MKKIIILILILLTTSTVKAHQSDISTTLLVEKENNTWVLQITAPLSAFQQEVRRHFSETPYKTPEEFQQMVLEHVKNNFQLNFDKKGLISLENGMVQLGHETNVIFQIKDIPSDFNSVLLKNTIFKDIYKNKNLLLFIKKGFKKESFVFNNDNRHTLELKSKGDQFLSIKKNEASTVSYQMVIILSIMFALAMFLYFRSSFMHKN